MKRLILCTVLASGTAFAQIDIAVFDNDFTGYEQAIGKTLPRTTYFYRGQYAAPVVSANGKGHSGNQAAHGLKMAEILSAELMPHIPFNLHLYEVGGFDNLKTAITSAINRGIEVIVHPLVREYGGNYDGKGFINAEVNRATRQGIIWINAAGNFARTSFTASPADVDEGDGVAWVKLPDYENSLEITCSPPVGFAKCFGVRIVLSWTDHKDDPTLGTDKDLDLILADDTGRKISNYIAGEFRQTKEDITRLDDVKKEDVLQTEQGPRKVEYSKYPREIVVADLEAGKYTLRVLNRSRNFTKSDRMRIATDNPYISFSQFDGAENLFNPADNPSVITVGANDSDRSSRSIALDKPDILFPSIITLPDGGKVLGSSNAAARAGARAALILVADSTLQREGVLERMHATLDQLASEAKANLSQSPYYSAANGTDGALGKGSVGYIAEDVRNPENMTAETPLVTQSAPQDHTPPSQTPPPVPHDAVRDARFHRKGSVVAVPATGFNFTSTQPDCFEPVDLPPQPFYIESILQRGGRFVKTTAGLRIAIKVDPVTLNPYLRRVLPNDMVVATPGGLILRPRIEMAKIPTHWAEVFQLPPHSRFCDEPPAVTGGYVP